MLLLIEQAIDYLQTCTAFPAVTSDIISRIVELVRLFDSRTRLLVLGAGAIQVSVVRRSVCRRTAAFLSFVFCRQQYSKPLC